MKTYIMFYRGPPSFVRRNARDFIFARNGALQTNIRITIMKNSLFFEKSYFNSTVKNKTRTLKQLQDIFHVILLTLVHIQQLSEFSVMVKIFKQILLDFHQ